MLSNTLESLINEIYTVLISSECKKYTLIKKHTENLKTQGDLSFPNKMMIWREYVNEMEKCSDIKWIEGNDLLLTKIAMEDLVEKSKNWIISIHKAMEENDRVHLYIERPLAFRVGLTEAIANSSVISTKLKQSPLPIHCDEQSAIHNSVTDLRVKYVCEAIKNLYVFNTKCLEYLPNLYVTSKSTSKNAKQHSILCGSVLNSKTGKKETAVTGEEFVRIRQEEMTLIAQHRYGVRVSTDTKWKDYAVHLGESAVRFELLQTRPSGTVKINFECSLLGSSKGAAFILYNCARLESILRTFNDNVNRGVYPELPDIEDVNFSLLTHEDEWSLVYNYVLGLPLLLNNCVEINKANGSVQCDFRPHFVCSFLSSMVREFSQYYRKCKVLTEPREHLLPVMFARLHMLRALNETLKSCLKILNIKSVSHM